MSNRKMDFPNVDFRSTVSPRQPPYFILVQLQLAKMEGVFFLFFFPAFLLLNLYPASRGFFLASLLACTKSFA